MSLIPAVLLSLILFQATLISGDDCKCGIETIRTRIINGKQSRPYTYPWVVYVQRTTRDETASCTGSIISPNFVLTAAHCVPDDFNAKTMKVYTWQGCGKHNLLTGPTYQVRRITRHPNFQWKMGDGYDVALLQLERPINHQTFMPICLSRETDNFESSVVTGWGMISNGWFKQDSDCLYEADIALTDPAMCKRIWPDANTDRVMCAGGYTGVCQGDSGGPLMSRRDGRMFQHGISSHTRGDCGISTKSPGVFERVHHHVDWIQQVTGNDGVCVK